jgi:hypothetical protein
MRRPFVPICCGVAIFIAATFGLWYGFVMSFLVPGMPGEPYFQRDRVLLGNVPLVTSVLALCAAGWFFRSALKSKITLSEAIICCIGSAAGLGFLFFVIGAAIHQR